METAMQDVRYGLRMLRKGPGFSVVVIGTLALGIAANAVIFTMVNSVLLRSLPFPNADQIVRVQERHNRANNLTGATFRDLRERNHVFAGVAAYRIFAQNFFATVNSAAPEEIDTAFVSQDFFPVLQTSPMMGGGFSPAQFREGTQGAILLSYRLWQRQFASDQQIVGKPVMLHGESRLVVGVMAKGFSFPDQVQAWVPLTDAAALSDNRRAHLFTVIGRLKAGISSAAVNTDLQAIAAGIQKDNPNVDPGFIFGDQELKDNLVADIRPALLLLVGAVAFVLLIACTNVANLLFSRSVARRKEIAIRAALGANSICLVRQLLTECLLLAACGGILGCGLGFALASVCIAAYPGAVPKVETAGLDLHTILFVCAVSLLAAILCGIFPALQISSRNLPQYLAEGGRTTLSSTRHRVRLSLVIGEVALAVVLLTGAGLLIRSFMRLQQVDPGYDTAHLLIASMTLPDFRYPELEQRLRFTNAALDRVRSMRGVRTAAAAGALPLRPIAETDFDIEGQSFHPGDEPSAQVLTASPEYFNVMGISVLSGRTFTPRDVLGRPTAVVINQAMAKRFWPGQSPLGKKMVMKDWGPDLPGEIVGVVADVKVDSLESPTGPAVYYSFAQFPQGTLTTYLIVHTESDPQSLATALRGQIWQVDREQPVNVFSMNQVISESLERRRFLLTLLNWFAAIALSLAVIGIFGIVSYFVGQRTHEFGIRLALGAQRGRVLVLVLKEGLAMATIGLAVGTVAAWFLTRSMRSLLFKVGPNDPLTFLLVSVLLLVVALAACCWPAYAAAKVDPMVVLRYE
jgi:putative ABC transport system permease protein